MRTIKHLSDCALHNEPALPRDKCTCRAKELSEIINLIDHFGMNQFSKGKEVGYREASNEGMEMLNEYAEGKLE